MIGGWNLAPALCGAGWLAAAVMACGDSQDVSLVYGENHPGLGLAEGGEIRHENVRFLGQPVQTWLMVYQYTAPESAVSAPFAKAENDGTGPLGNCVDERTSATWPFTPITNATYLELPKVQLSGPGISGKLDVVKSTPVNTVGNSTFRSYGFTYGGGAPGTPPMGFNGMLTAEMSTPDQDYTIDIGKGNAMEYHMPAAYTAPLGIGGAATVMIPAHKDLEFTWTAPPNDKGSSNLEHNKSTYFNFTFFADPTSTNPPQFICFADQDGHTKVPAAVIDALPPGGLIVNADLSHYLEAREASPGEVRRFDLVSIFCNISLYAKQ